jgi:hypothetical protein
MEKAMKLTQSTAATALETVVVMGVTTLVSVFIVALVAIPQPGFIETAAIQTAPVELAVSSFSALWPHG